MGLQRIRPSHEILSGATADVYFARANSILDREGLDPVVTDGGLLPPGRRALRHGRGHEPASAMSSPTSPARSWRRSRTATSSRPRRSSSGSAPATAPSPCTRPRCWACSPSPRAGPPPPASASRRRRPSRSSRFGARHVHPDITDVLDYAAIVGGCVGASTPAGARLAGLNPTGTMPHSLVLIFGDTVRAAEAFDRDMPAGRAADRARRHVQGRGRGGAPRRNAPGRPAVRHPPGHAVRARPGHRGAGHRGPGPAGPGGLLARDDHGLRRPDPRPHPLLQGRRAPRWTRSPSARHISGATPIDFTGDIKEIDGTPIAKRGRIPGGPRAPAQGLDLAAWRDL